MTGLFRNVWRLMTGEVINDAEVDIHNGTTKVILALRRAKNGDLFVSLKEDSGSNKQWVAFEPNEFDQFVAAVNLIRDALAFERAKQAQRD